MIIKTFDRCVVHEGSYKGFSRPFIGIIKHIDYDNELISKSTGLFKGYNCTRIEYCRSSDVDYIIEDLLNLS
jgi:hypothetical protein